MNGFKRFYLWGVNTKYRMGLYFAAVVFFKGLVNALLGVWTIDILTLLEMMVACFVFAALEVALFPAEEGRLTDGRRIAVWAAIANLIAVGCAWGLDWFPGIPVWGNALLILTLEAALSMMWYALRLREKRDTAALNRGLQRFQAER